MSQKYGLAGIHLPWMVMYTVSIQRLAQTVSPMGVLMDIGYVSAALPTQNFSKFDWKESARCVARVFAHHNHRQKSYLQPWPEHPFRSRKKSNLNRKVELTAWTRSWATCERFPVLVSVPATNPGAFGFSEKPTLLYRAKNCFWKS